MARPIKKGLDYFQMRVDFWEQKELYELVDKKGEIALLIYYKIVAHIYRNEGYYMETDSYNRMRLHVKIESEKGLVEDLLNYMIEIGLFDKTIYEKYNIITSKEIQQMYTFGTKERKNVVLIKDYMVITEDEANDSRNEVKVGKIKFERLHIENNVTTKPKEYEDDLPY